MLIFLKCLENPVAGEKLGRITEKEITVFKSVGTAITDVATALKAYKLAKEKGVGHYISILD
jgi:ornithine cyclodeaminase